MCQQYYKLYDIPISILRIFSVYGPGLKKQILWDIYNQIKSSDRVYLDGTGQETRDFIFIDDLTKVVASFLKKSSYDCNIVNVGTSQSITVKKLAQTLIAVSGKIIPLEFSARKRQGDPVAWALKCEGFMNELPFNLTTLILRYELKSALY